MHRGLRDREDEEDRLERERAEEERKKQAEIERLAQEELKKLKLRRTILLGACALVASACFIYLITYSIAGKKNEETADLLSEGLSNTNASSGMSAYLQKEQSGDVPEVSGGDPAAGAASTPRTGA